MANEVIVGTSGSVNFGAPLDAWVIIASGWTLEIEVVTVETTNFSSAGYREHKVAMVGGSGSITGFAEDTELPTKATFLASTLLPTDAEGQITLQGDAGNTFAATCAITGLSFDRRPEEAMSYTLNFVTSGRIIQTWG